MAPNPVFSNGIPEIISKNKTKQKYNPPNKVEVIQEM